jgi:hypothetical protein
VSTLVPGVGTGSNALRSQHWVSGLSHAGNFTAMLHVRLLFSPAAGAALLR